MALLTIDGPGVLVLMAVDALRMGRIGCLAHFSPLDVVGIMAFETGFGKALSLGPLMTGSAGAVILPVGGMVVTVLTGNAIAVFGKVSLVIEHHLPCNGPVHDSKRFFGGFGGIGGKTENSDEKRDSSGGVSQLKLFPRRHCSKVLYG